MKIAISNTFNCVKPYLLITIAAIVGFLPVSTMMFSLKNDIIVLDYPIKYFISQCLQNNIPPFWFNTWAMGFPLESFITWSIFSPQQFFIGALIEYNLYFLHVEFICYIALSGFSMFYLLNKHISKSRHLNILLAICYMLSGFNIGSSQWMTYLTASAFLPLVLACFISFLKNPSLKTTVLFVTFFYIMLTSAYPAFTIISTYVLFGVFLIYLARKLFSDNNSVRRTRLFNFLGLGLLLVVTFYSISIYYSFQVLSNIERGMPMASNTTFFNSNYLHPKGLSTLLLPFSSTKFLAFNTEGAMTDCYIGLLPMLALPYCLQINIKEKSGFSLLILATAFLFLLLSFGSITPMRDFANLLPGFNYFRNPALFRLFFILFFLVYIGFSLNKFSLNNNSDKLLKKYFKGSALILGSFFLFLILIHLNAFNNTAKNFQSFKSLIRTITYEETLLISSLLQLFFLAFLILAIQYGKLKLVFLVFVLELIINCLVCTPFFTVSSYSVKETNDKILASTDKFPVQKSGLLAVGTSHHQDGANWYNINIYRKQISARNSYFGPLTLKSFTPITEQNHKEFIEIPLLFSNVPELELRILQQRPDWISAQISNQGAAEIFFQQNYYDGWQAYYNNERIKIHPDQGRMKIVLTGSGMLEFRYEKTFLFISVIIINVIVLAITIFHLTNKIIRHLHINFKVRNHKNAFSFNRKIEA